MNFHRVHFVINSAGPLNRLIISFVMFISLFDCLDFSIIASLGIDSFAFTKNAVVICVAGHHVLLLAIECAACFALAWYLIRVARKHLNFLYNCLIL